MIPNPIKFLAKPEYFWRPSQVLRRFARMGKPTPMQATVRLPWGAVLQVRTGDAVGADIYYYGIFDKIVPEAVWRLSDQGETDVDAGANIGQNSSLMWSRVGCEGRVIAFEPHPEIFQELQANHDRSRTSATAPVQLENVALGAAPGEAWLDEGEYFYRNRGTSKLLPDAPGGKGIKVKVRRLDEYLANIKQVGVFKIDVEGHELGVLQGAEDTLKRRGIRDIVFEDLNPKPSPVMRLLEQHGFTLFELHDTWLKPRLKKLDPALPATRPGFSCNYLATLDPARAVARFRSAGWHCLLGL